VEPVDAVGGWVVTIGQFALYLIAIGGVLSVLVKYTIVNPLKNDLTLSLMPVQNDITAVKTAVKAVKDDVGAVKADLADAVLRINTEVIQPIDNRLKTVESEWRPNGGSSTYDAIRRIEDTQRQIQQDMKQPPRGRS
jgi:hypothetical protein